MTLSSQLYRDPLDILINEEAKTCRGCKHEQKAFECLYCDLGKKHGNHCKSYDEAINGNS